MKTNIIKSKTLSETKYKVTNVTYNDFNKLIKLKVVIHLYAEYYFNKVNNLIYKRIYQHNWG